MYFTAGQLPYKPGINRSKAQFPVLRFFPRTLDMIQNPFDLTSGKIRVDYKSRLIFDFFFIASGFECIANAGRLPGLPYNWMINRKACHFIPDDSRFSLIGNPNTGYLFRL